MIVKKSIIRNDLPGELETIHNTFQYTTIHVFAKQLRINTTNIYSIMYYNKTIQKTIYDNL